MYLNATFLSIASLLELNIKAKEEVKSDIKTKGEADSPLDSTQNSLLESNSLPITSNFNLFSRNEVSQEIILEIKDILRYNYVPTNFF